MTGERRYGGAILRLGVLLPQCRAGRRYTVTRAATRQPGRRLRGGVAAGIGVRGLPASAQAGLVTVVIAGVFSGWNLQVSGPTWAMTVVLVSVIAHFGATGYQWSVPWPESC